MVHHDKPKGFPERLDCCGQGHDKGSKFKWIFFATSSFPPFFFFGLSCHLCSPGIPVPSSIQGPLQCCSVTSNIQWHLLIFQCNIARQLPTTMLIISSKLQSQLECASPLEKKAHPTHAHTHLPSTSCTQMPMPHSQALVDNVEMTIYRILSWVNPHTCIYRGCTYCHTVFFNMGFSCALEGTGNK